MNKKFNLDKFNIIQNPFPLIIYNDFLTNIQNEEVYNGILNFNNFDSDKWGGRKQIRKETDNFSSLLENNQTIKDLYSFFNDKEIFDYFYSKFKRISKDSEYNFKLKNKHLVYKQKYKKNIIQNIKNIFFFKTRTSFLEMDFSLAQSGYFREPHHDKNTRIINFLIYFNDLNEEDGGSLDIYGYKSMPKVFKTQPDEDLIIKQKSFLPKKKQLIIFLSNPISIHGVSKIVSNKKRIFAYGSYTLEKNVDGILN